MKILVLGATGMLGSAVTKYFIENEPDADIYATYRNVKWLNCCDYMKEAIPVKFDALQDKVEKVPVVDYVINCIGVTKPHINDNHGDSIAINSLFPHRLASDCGRSKSSLKLIHISSDCVFSGRAGAYLESQPHNCIDFYGKSKSLGEPSNCMVLRTSIIGEEAHGYELLIGWLKKQAGGSIDGFSHHLWNGMTTKEYAKCCHKIILKDLYENGVFHIFSPESITKYRLLTLLNEKFDLCIKISNVTGSEAVDMTLDSSKGLVDYLGISSIEKQITEM